MQLQFHSWCPCLQRNLRGSPCPSLPASAALGSAVSPNSAMPNAPSPLIQPVSPTNRNIRPIATHHPRPGSTQKSPRGNLNHSGTLLPHVTSSRPGSPIAPGGNSGIHVTSRVAQPQSGGQGVRPPPIHMMLHNLGRPSTVRLHPGCPSSERIACMELSSAIRVRVFSVKYLIVLWGVPLSLPVRV